MKNYQNFLNIKLSLKTVFLFFVFLGFQNSNYATNKILTDTIGFEQYRGIVINSKNKKPLVYATLIVNNTNISSITNSHGEFLLKIPTEYKNNRITVSFLGYTSKVVDFKDFDKEKIVIKLETHIEELTEIAIEVKDPETLIREMLNRKVDNYFDFPTEMTAFYRETIKKRRTYVSLSEAVVDIKKQSYNSSRVDLLKLFKARKNTDYNKLDTITLKLKGGPLSAIRIDVMKNTSDFFDLDTFEKYDFKFDTSTKIDNRPIYVVNFKQKPSVEESLNYGKLFIDANTFALTSIIFHVNLEDKVAATRRFIVKKPRKAKVEAIEASYQINYREKNGKWFYAYSRIQLGFKINYDKRLFNSVYHLTMEMAITNWKKNTEGNTFKFKERLKSSVILSDEASGFSDPEFWGDYNVIEPEKPIESAIKKIQKQLKKAKK
ncbi:carboxypeptidase-like regulatory domain-containing protein [Lutibacter citreus]|uniref:carboxypeptidase-like regulatory domain-containing protein n=1 Tax=Lutibacter citreus TaxID=2138210 RepID=UPI000DBE34EC|nr:carboxypeptidase-like regulatory domain-containing protein [Lutibacter citreus]